MKNITRQDIFAPDHTAVRVALWRALHVQIDSKPHVLTDEIGAKLVGEVDWQNRPDMDPQFSKSMRASIVGRARFVEDLVEEAIKNGASQYVILGAGLDTFAQRRPDLATKVDIFEVDQPGPQACKQERLKETGFEIPKRLHFVPINFETGPSWLDQLIAHGFDARKPSIVVSTGVSLYLTKDANMLTFRQLAQLAKGSTFAMTFMLSLELLDEKERSLMEFVMKRASESGTPFLSLFNPAELTGMLQDAGFKKSQYISGEDLYQRYFAQRTDGLRAGNAEAFMVAST